MHSSSEMAPNSYILVVSYGVTLTIHHGGKG
jgi:hypothetical protein